MHSAQFATLSAPYFIAPYAVIHYQQVTLLPVEHEHIKLVMLQPA